jgi:hypothetical protein
MIQHGGPDSETIERFTDGYCDYFARALQEKFGYELRFISDNWGWLHCVAYREIDNTYFDVRGKIMLIDLFEEFPGNRVLKLDETGYEMDKPLVQCFYKLAHDVIDKHMGLYL